MVVSCLPSQSRRSSKMGLALACRGAAPHLSNRNARNDSLRTDHGLLVIAPLPALAPLRHSGLLSVHLAKWTLSDISAALAGQSDRTLTFLSLPLHLMTETPVWPSDGITWASILLGLGPVGLAFYVWDIGMKKCDIPVLCTASYAALLLSTLVFIAAVSAKPSLALLLSAVLITDGALLAVLTSWRAQQSA